MFGLAALSDATLIKQELRTECTEDRVSLLQRADEIRLRIEVTKKDREPKKDKLSSFISLFLVFVEGGGEVADGGCQDVILELSSCEFVCVGGLSLFLFVVLRTEGV